MTKQRYIKLILILGALTTIGPFSIDMYLPSFSAIAKSFNTTTNTVGYSLTSYFVGIALGQLIYGPLMDRFSRLMPLYCGLALYILSSFACSLASSIEALVALRFLQAVGGCAGGVASMAMVRDLFPVKDSAKVFSLLMLVLGVSPMFAPTVGSYVSVAFGWPAIFISLAVITFCILIAVYFGLPESTKPDKEYSLKPALILKSYLSVLKEPQFVTFALCGSIAVSCLLAYVASSPNIFMEGFAVDANTYGWIFATLAMGFIGSNQVNRHLLKTHSNEQLIFFALIGGIIISIAFIASSYFGLLDLYSTIAIIFAFLCTLGFIMPNTAALAMAPFSKNAGTASSLLGAMQMFMGSATSIALSSIKGNSSFPLAVTFAICAALSLATYHFGKRMIHHHLNKPKKSQLASDNIIM